MQAVILCGGKGTRLSSLYADRPKILVPVAGRPFIEWQLDWLVGSGVQEVHLAGGYMAASLSDWLTNHGKRISNAFWRLSRAGGELGVTLSEESLPLGTAGGLRFVEPYVTSDPFLVLNGDSVMPNLDFKTMIGMHAEPNIVMAVTRIEESGRYGTVDFDGACRVTAFQEKARRENGWVNGGVYLMSRSILANIPQGTPVSMETEIFPFLASAGRLLVCVAPPPLLDMGTPEGIESMATYMVALSKHMC